MQLVSLTNGIKTHKISLKYSFKMSAPLPEARVSNTDKMV